PGVRVRQQRRPRGGAPAAARARRPPPPRVRPRGGRRAHRDVVEAGGLQRGQRRPGRRRARDSSVNGADVLEIVGIAVAIVGVGLMAASEVGITRTTKIRAYHLVEEGKRGATSLLKIVENPPPYLNVVLLLTLVFTIGGTTIATNLATHLFHRAGEVVATIGMTLLLFIFAEVTPKTYAIQHTDRLALRVAPLILGLGRLFGPLAKLLVKLAYAITPGRGLPQGPYVTEQEIRTMADVASDEDQIEEEE